MVEDGWYCFDTEDSFFAINPDDEKGTYPDGCSKADIDDTTLSTYKSRCCFSSVVTCTMYIMNLFEFQRETLAEHSKHS